MHFNVLSKGRLISLAQTDPDTTALKGQLMVAVMEAGMTILPLAMQLSLAKEQQA